MLTHKEQTGPREGTYVLVTPARNEERHIARTIESVLAQTRRPLRWVIVSDASTDRTDEIAAICAEEHEFIEFIRSSAPAEDRDFGSKVRAFNVGHARLAGEEYDFIGNLDADVTVEPHYFERLLARFAERPRLGLAGGIVLELVDGQFRGRMMSLNSVSGAVQLFRREVFEGINGYVPLALGGEDALAEIKTRMHGWSVETFPDLKVRHHRRVVSGRRDLWASRFWHGVVHYRLGYHPLFQLFASLKRLRERPWILGSLLVLAGYLWGVVGVRQRSAPEEVMRFLRREQVGRLRDALLGRDVRVVNGRSAEEPAPSVPADAKEGAAKEGAAKEGAARESTGQ
jgi:glycosyltransferase involved in cell wall biosynthesis